MNKKKINSIQIVFACGHTFTQLYPKGATKREMDVAALSGKGQICPKCENKGEMVNYG